MPSAKRRKHSVSSSHGLTLDEAVWSFLKKDLNLLFVSPGLIWDPEAPFSEASIGKSGAFIVLFFLSI